MKTSRLILPRGSVVKRNEINTILIIALSWTIIDFILFLIRLGIGSVPSKYADPEINNSKIILLREVDVFLVSLIVGYFIVSVLRNFLQNSSFGFNLLIKTVILVFVAIAMNFIILFSYYMLIEDRTASQSVENFFHNTFRAKWLLEKMPEWIILFLLTLLAIEVNTKYSSGVFFSIMLGRYLHPKDEKRIIMFVDLKNSTPIAEKLGAHEYFKFIRDVIFCISAGIIEKNGRIYQYVGDEVVAWWPSSKKNARRCVYALLEARKILNKNGEVFKRDYDIIPEYKVGLHEGLVTIGQVGIMKKDLVMSGDTMNTGARIRSACTDTNQKIVASKDIIDMMQMKEWQTENLGFFDLKGKNHSIELFALKI